MSVLHRTASKLLRSVIVSKCNLKYFSAALTTPEGCSGDPKKPIKGLVLGVYDDGGICRLTEAATKYNELCCNKLMDLLQTAGPCPKPGIARVFFGIEPDFAAVAVVGLGKECLGFNDMEERDDGKEAIRVAAAVGCRELQKLRLQSLFIEGFGHCESAAEGSGLAVWLYQELRNPANHVYIPQLDLYHACDWDGWQIGLQKAAAQNLARQLMETPANLMTPTMFAQNAVECLCKSGVNVEVKVASWAQTQKMGAFLAVAKGSCEPPIFLELSYYGAAYEERPIVLIGSGVTFDSGGTCLKKPRFMRHMRGDLSGAACVVAAVRALALLQLPINIRGLIPLCENMPGCSAYRPGDTVQAMNGKNIFVENTDCEGRLMLADALYYSQNFWPRFVLDVGTLTLDVGRAMGTAATACMTNSDRLWEKIHSAGMHTGDRMWRFPLWDFYSRQMKADPSVDLVNVGEGRGGGACKAAAFLREFVPCGEWLHLDSYGVMSATGKEYPYLRTGMSGRPTRTIIEFVSSLVCKDCT